MSDTPTPSLLSEERLAEIKEVFIICQQLSARLAQPDAAGLAIPTNETAEYYAAMAFDLLADRAACRQQVADELRGLRETFKPEGAPGVQLAVNGIVHDAITRVAARLNLDLTAPTP